MRSASVLAVLAGLAVGCGGPGSPTTNTAAPPTGRIGLTRTVNMPPAVELKEVAADELVAAVKGYKDKVVVVDFWATWCGPCVKKFPHLVAMHKAHAADGLVCVSVDMGKLGTHDRAAAVEFLNKQGAAFPNFTLLRPDADSKAMDAMFGDANNTRMLPYLAVFDRGGRRVWDSEANPDATPEQVEAKVADLLKK